MFNNLLSRKSVVVMLTVITIALTIYVIYLQKELSSYNKSSYGVVTNESKDVFLSLPDSTRRSDLKTISATIDEYFENVNRFKVDSAAGLSLTALALEGKAMALRKKLLPVLPKFTVTTNSGGEELIRQYYVVEGDIKVDRDMLYLYCKDRLKAKDKNAISKNESNMLTLATGRDGKEVKWPNGTVIKYCIKRNSFASKAVYDSVVKEMRDATSAWMGVCNIRFQYDSALDKSDVDLETESDSTNILFVVRQINADGAFIAQSFFPSDLPYNRFLLLDNSFFTSAYSRIGVLRHELGHILGFRHEHIWSKDESCGGEKLILDELGLGGTAITTYDPYSVMHYPCGQNKDNFAIQLTDFDKKGALKVYPFDKPVTR